MHKKSFFNGFLVWIACMPDHLPLFMLCWAELLACLILCLSLCYAEQPHNILCSYTFFQNFQISWQFASSPTCFIRFQPNLVTSKYLWMATKVISLKINRKSCGVTGVKKAHFKKMLLLLQFTWDDLEIFAHEQASQSLQNVLERIFDLRLFGVTGFNLKSNQQKRFFFYTL